MTIENIFACVAVSDLARAEGFYTDLLGTPPAARPMAGLIEYHFGTAVLQVTADAARAGGSLATVWVDRLDAADGDTSAGGSFRRHTDPDGNGITLVTGG